MFSFLVLLQNFLTQPLRRDDRGASAVEYGLLVFLIALVIIIAVTLLGTNLSSIFNKVATDL
jgi:pilus assembly protein Flp/PilA